MRHNPPFITGTLPGETAKSSELVTEMLNDIFDGPAGRDFILGKGNSSEGLGRSGMELGARAEAAVWRLTIARLMDLDPDKVMNGPIYKEAVDEVSQAIRQESGIDEQEGGN